MRAGVACSILVVLCIARPASACVVGCAGPGCPPGVAITEHPPADCGGPPLVGVVSGVAANVDTAEVVVVLYAEAGQLYIQPAPGSPTEIHCDGTFQNQTRGGQHYVAILARRSWNAPDTMCELPPIGGDVLAVARAPERRIQFAGREWRVKSTLPATTTGCRIGPGPNYWSDSAENVWVDGGGRLHLKITRRLVGGEERWFCAEVSTADPVGYGGPTLFELEGPVDQLDRNVVAGLFTYYCDYLCTPAICGHHEIDIEIAGDALIPGPDNAQYAVQRYESCLVQPFVMPPLSASTHAFWWRDGAVEFGSWRGHRPAVPHPDSLIAGFTYESPACVPSPLGESLRINLWLFGGEPPTDDQEVELVIEGARVVGIGDQGIEPAAPEGGLLRPNAPNPFGSATAIRFDLDAPAPVSLRIYDSSGRLVRTLVDGTVMPGGSHRVSWDGTDGRGERVVAGAYFYDLRAGKEHMTRKAIVVE